MRVVTPNLNGIRSAAKKGFFGWMRRQEADVVCVYPFYGSSAATAANTLRRLEHCAPGDRPQELRSNKKNAGFLPEERAWISSVFDELGYVDVFRRINREPEQYTWWSNRGRAWAKNVGWRIDYQIAMPGIAEKATAEVDLQAHTLLGSRAADHRLQPRPLIWRTLWR